MPPIADKKRIDEGQLSSLLFKQSYTILERIRTPSRLWNNLLSFRGGGSQSDFTKVARIEIATQLYLVHHYDLSSQLT